MSEFTFATIVKDKTAKELIKYIKKTGIDGYVLPVNKDWCAAFFDKHSDIWEKLSLSLSQDLETHLFYFYNCEDFGWGYHLFYNGKQTAYIKIGYDNNMETDITEANIPLLEKLGGKQEILNKFQNFLSNFDGTLSDLDDGVKFFKEAFNFEKIEWLSYEYLLNIEPDELNNLSVFSVQKQNKPLNTKKIIMKVMKKKLSDMGYIYDKAYYRGGHTFAKIENEFLVGLTVNIDGSRAEYILRSPIMDLPCKTFFYDWGCFNNQEELETLLEVFLNSFIKNGDKFIHEELLLIETFDIFETYKNYIDNLFDEHGFKRISMENEFLGLAVTYGRDDIKICIQHDKMNASLSYTIINKKGERLFLNVIMSSYYYPDDFHNYFPIYYKNRTEFIENIKKHLNFLVEANFPQSYNVKKC